jgi:hypothetical protein
MPVWISPLVIISQKPKTMIKLCTAFGEYMHIHSTSTHAQSSTRPLFTDMPQNSKAWSLTMRSPAGRLCRSGHRVTWVSGCGVSGLLECRGDNLGIAIQTPLQFVRGIPVTAGW